MYYDMCVQYIYDNLYILIEIPFGIKSPMNDLGWT